MLKITFEHRWALFPQKATVTSFSLYCLRYLPHKKLKLLYRSRCLHTQKIQTIKSFFLLQSLAKVTVNRSRYGIDLKNGTVKSFPLLSFFNKRKIYIVLITNVKLKLLHRSC
jgi:hypothetical protein